MTVSDTLSIFVPGVGPVSQETLSGDTVRATNVRGDVTTTISDTSGDGVIDGVALNMPTGANSSTTIFNADSTGIFFTGSGGSEDFVTLNGDVANASILTNGGDDTLISGDVSNSTFNLGQGDNTAITGELDDVNLISGKGADYIGVQGDVDSSQISTNAGDDTLVFGGAVTNSTVNLGAGADYASFAGSIEDTFIDLGGPDGAVDTIALNSRDDIGTGTLISNADDGDLLIIGADEYAYDEVSSTWISDDDTINFFG